MRDELKSPVFNQIWQLVMLPMGKKELHNKLFIRWKRKMMATRDVELTSYQRI